MTTFYKSTAITNLDLLPAVRATQGASGGSGLLRHMDSGPVTIADASATTDHFLMVRLPSNVYVKHLWFMIDASVTTLAIDVGAYYSDATQDGTQFLKQGTLIDVDYFGANVDVHTVAYPIDFWSTKAAATALTGALMIKPLWAALALTSDPAGFIDIALTPHATTSGAAIATLRAEYLSA